MVMCPHIHRIFMALNIQVTYFAVFLGCLEGFKVVPIKRIKLNL